MKKSVLAVLWLGCWFAGNHPIAIAQGIPKRDVYVANPLNRTMKFAILCASGDKQELTKHELKSRSSDLYTCEDWRSSIVLRVVTGHKAPVVVELEPKKRYEFYWNSDKSQWDLREIAPRT